MSDLWVDHVIYAVDDLDAAGARFRAEFGLGSVPGGRHPGWGTANRIVPFGHEYVELVTIVDRQEAAASEFGRAVTQALAGGHRLLGWAVATDDIHGIATRLSLDVTRGSRTRPDGSTLSWQLAGAAPALSTGALPFFLQWDGPPELHPGAAVVEHGVRADGIAWIEISGDEQALRAWLGDHDLPVRVIEGPPSMSAAGISAGEREIVLR
ncbi:MAG TPA: VOC family protein [Solirubrobacteraceae bacterium]|nr:VOC family protein [Solirubrobacteraceae bacterium]